jgi:uncharacterized protein YjbI with pentapeptide repeats
MARCKDFTICELEDTADPEAGLCILHSKRSDKDAKLFSASLTIHRAKRGNNFTRMVFPGLADFAGVSFGGPAFFHGATFLGSADFTGASFKDAAFFQDATFGARADFTWATCDGPATFSRVRFLTEATFAGATFSAAANFSRAEFAGKAEWPDVTFAGPADFTASRFAEAAFAGVQFVQTADFSDGTFAGPADFGRARFRGPAHLARVTFAGVDFTGAVFAGGEVDFSRSHFAGAGRFAGGGQKERGDEIFAGAQAGFAEVAVDPAAVLTIRDADLTACRLLGTEVAGIRFQQVRWPVIRDRGEMRSGVFDEIAPLPEGATRPWSAIARLYRELKRQYLARGEYEQAGAFHYGEKEMQRKDPATPRALRLLLAASWAAWGHGERFLRPLCWLGLLLLLSTVGYLAGGLAPIEGGAALSVDRPWDWVRAAHHAMQVMVLITPLDLAPVQCAKGVATLERVAGPVLIGLFLLAVRHRLRW